MCFSDELAKGQGTVIDPPFSIADLKTYCAVGVGGRDRIECQRGKPTGADGGGPIDLPPASGQLGQVEISDDRLILESFFRLFNLFVGDEAGSALGGAQPARLARNLRIKAVDDVNLLVAAGVYDPLFHVRKRAVGNPPDQSR